MLPIPEHPQGQSDKGRLSRRSFLEFSGATALLASAELLTHAGRAYPAETSKKIRMGVVGGGFGAAFFWHEHPNCVVTGVTDLWPQRRTILRDTYRCNKAYDSLEIMVKEAKDIDAAAVFSGAPDHAKHVQMCMERGWHVVSAVPACITLEEAAMLKQLKEKTGLRYMMAESSWYKQECIFARNLYREGGFGELFYIDAEYYHDLGDLDQILSKSGENTRLFYTYDGSRTWRWGYPPMLYTTHSLGFLVGVSGERIRKVSSLGWRGTSDKVRKHPLMTENAYGNPFWSAASMMLTDRGHMCRVNEFRRCTAHGERAQWFGDKATLYMPGPAVAGAVETVRAHGTTPVTIPEYWKTADMLPEVMRHGSHHGGSAAFISAEFVNALLEDREPEVDLYEALAMTVPGIVAHQSCFKDGEQLEVPQFDRLKTSQS
jgi:predicted dehydrogenase